MKLNFIQDIASPHNNVIAAALEGDSDIDLNLWYCQNQAAMYGWKEDLTNAIKPAMMYKHKSIDFKFLWYCLTKKDEKFLIVGWQNINTKILFILFFLLRRKYSVWFDCPNDSSSRNPIKKIVREFFYDLLKYSNAHVFGVGKMTLDYFKDRGFSEKRLTNLPIFVDISKTPEQYQANKVNIYKKYNVNEGDLFLSSGSRLVYDKGFDILIDAIAQLPKDIQKHTKCVIVGKGEEKENLEKQIKANGLEQNIFMEEWMDIEDFRSLASSSHAFIHCARFDAYGGGTLNAMAAACMVIGTFQSGSAPDRVVSEESGFLYDASDKGRLTEIILWCFNNKKRCAEMSKKAFEIALLWHPSQGVETLRKHLL
tara:strand:+ start:46933 stop:48036 length:1104 start_codon:yes stop_codon:yes gene_type:complete